MVIKMRTYYLFIIKDNVKKTYENNSGDLYQKLKIIKNSDINLNYKLTLYKQICNEFKTDVISSYLNKLKNLKNSKNKYLFKFQKEISLLELNHATSVIITNLNFSYFLKIFYYYNKNILVCDFQNDDYFWLSKLFNKENLFEYN